MSHKMSWVAVASIAAAYGYVAVRLTLSDRFYAPTLIRPPWPVGHGFILKTGNVK
jgi:hypothetical protein